MQRSVFLPSPGSLQLPNTKPLLLAQARPPPQPTIVVPEDIQHVSAPCTFIQPVIVDYEVLEDQVPYINPWDFMYEVLFNFQF